MLFAYRTAIQSSTGKTPHELLFGRHARLPVDAEFDQPFPLPESADEYVEKLAVRMRQAREIVDTNIAEGQYRQACNYNKTAHKVVLTPGDFVYLYNPAVPKGMVAKLHRPL